MKPSSAAVEIPFSKPVRDQTREKELTAVSECPSFGCIFWNLLGAVGWGAFQWWGVWLIVGPLGWRKLPYNTVEEVLVWLFLAINGSAWWILCYSLWRYGRPGHWFWWGSCAALWLTLYAPLQDSRAAFTAKARASEVEGSRLAARIEAFRREHGRLPGQLREVALRDGLAISVTAFETNFDYRQEDLVHFQVAVPAGDKTFVYSSREPRRGFALRYFGQ